MKDKTISRGIRFPIYIHNELSKQAKEQCQPVNIIVIRMLQDQIWQQKQKQKFSIIEC